MLLAYLLMMNSLDITKTESYFDSEILNWYKLKDKELLENFRPTI
jgi:hypothetical protein